MSNQRITSQPVPLNGMNRQPTDERCSDDDGVSVFSFSDSVKSSGWCGCFGSSGKSKHEEQSQRPTNQRQISQETNHTYEKHYSPSANIPTSHNTTSIPFSNTNTKPNPHPHPSQGYLDTAFQPYDGMPIPTLHQQRSHSQR
ncbi:uncharacterized protein L201_003478 [Kwoniella dendrophila CBS 6074]|uniref:Uncharacterized protein n=1 Tax=Kwoniella dendrophila CBS 6074 TaxID=1295534 RepID=A0AAX4JTN0_9TREE